MGASSLVRSWLAQLWTDHLGVHDPGEGRTARPASFATFATAVAFGCQFDHIAPPYSPAVWTRSCFGPRGGRDRVWGRGGAGEGLPPVRDLFNKPTISRRGRTARGAPFPPRGRHSHFRSGRYRRSTRRSSAVVPITSPSAVEATDSA